MYIHIVPQLIQEFYGEVKLLSVSIPELNFNIEQTKLFSKNPYPNKNYQVGMTKNRKAIIGILLKTEKKLKKFTTIYEWEVERLGKLTHVIENYIEDEKYDLVSQDITLNIGFSDFENRVYKKYEGISPMNIMAVMRTTPSIFEQNDKPKRLSIEEVIKKHELNGFVSYRKDELHLHTIELKRLENPIVFGNRYTLTKDAIVI